MRSRAKPVLVANIAGFAGIAGLYALVGFGLHFLVYTGLRRRARLLLGGSRYRYEWKDGKHCHRKRSHGCSPFKPCHCINVRISEHFHQVAENL